MMRMRWEHWVNFITGGWLFASPWILDYRNEPFTAACNALIAAAGILVCSRLALQFEEKERTARATSMIIGGAWTVLAPWMLTFMDPAMRAANTVGVGFLVLLMSAWIVAEESSLIRWRRKRTWTLLAQE